MLAWQQNTTRREELAPTDPTAPRFHAFLSYSHVDSRITAWLHRSLEAYTVPATLVGKPGAYGPIPKRLTPIFRDEEELPGSNELGPKLEQALRDSAALVVICSPASAKSRWVDREIRLFKTVNPDRPVLAIIADGAPGSAKECFPAALKLARTPEGEFVVDESIEPLAPNLETQSRTAVKLKLIAGLLGVGYDELFHREERRARKRMAALGTLAVVIIGALSLLSAAALFYARVAVEQRNIAEKARAAAVRSQHEAEQKAWLANEAAEAMRSQFAVAMAKPADTPAPVKRARATPSASPGLN